MENLKNAWCTFNSCEMKLADLQWAFYINNCFILWIGTFFLKCSFMMMISVIRPPPRWFYPHDSTKMLYYTGESATVMWI